MPHPFERLLQLSQKTKSTLIAYDRHGEEHFVVMGIDDFESLHEGKHPPKDPKDPIHPPHLPEPELGVTDDVASDALLLEKLNRDIANWRSVHEQTEHKNSMENMAGELDEHELDSETSESSETLEFSGADETETAVEEVVIENFNSNVAPEPEIEESVKPVVKPPQAGNSSWTPLGSVLAKVYPKFQPEATASDVSSEINYDPITEPRNPILPATNLGEEEIGPEEPLEDEPIFFEEPVE